MSKTAVWMPLYVADYLADTMRLNGAQHGAYLLLIMEYWRNGPPPDNDAELAAIARTDLKLWRKDVGPVVRRFFEVKEGSLRHKRIDLEIAKAHENSNKRRAAAQARWEQEGCKPDASASVVHTESNATRAHAPSSSPSSLPSSLRSDGAVGVNGHGGLFPDQKPPDTPEDPKKRVFQDGRAILERLGVKGEPGALIAQWLKLLNGDAPALLDTLYAAEREKPIGAVAWIRAAIKTRGADVPRDDPWGIRTWLRRQPDTKPGKHAQTGADVTCINGFPVEEMAMEIAEAARLPDSWRGNWDAFGVWMREELVSTSAAIDAIRSQARRMTEPVHSIAVFDRAVRGA